MMLWMQTFYVEMVRNWSKYINYNTIIIVFLFKQLENLNHNVQHFISRFLMVSTPKNKMSIIL